MQKSLEVGGVERKTNRVGDIFREFNIREGEPIPASIVREIVVQNEAALTEGLARNFYHQIKASLSYRMAQSISSSFYGLRQSTPSFEEGERLVDFIWFLKTEAKTPGDKFKRMDECKLVFTYAADPKRIENDNKWAVGNAFTGYDVFALKKITQGAMPMGVFKDRKAFDIYPDIRENAVTTVGEAASYENVYAFLELALKEAESFPEASARIDAIWGKYQFPLEDAEKLKQAIWEFGNHDYKRRGGLEMHGDCLVIPGNFESLVRKRFGIELQHCELTGARKMRDELSREEKAELAAGREGNVVHEASIYENTAIIDWTSRQFDKTRPLPEITDLNENPALKARIEIG